MTEQVPNPSQIISSEESQFIRENYQGDIYLVAGFLSAVRLEGKTVEEVYQDAMSQPFQEEHHVRYGHARNFLANNAARFGIEITRVDNESLA